jgi:uncharacterized protein (DUF1330 family)
MGAESSRGQKATQQAGTVGRNQMMNERFVLVVSFWLKDGDLTRFEAFERDAALRMVTYGGRIERAIRIDEYDGKADHPFEVHIVSFPDRSAFRAYQQDPDTHNLASLRSEVISRSSVLAGYDVEIYA